MNIKAITKILGLKFCGVKMAEPKNKNVGNMEPPYVEKC